MSVYAIIPARLRSTRLPRKLLLAETGRPLLQYTWETANRASSLQGVRIAADDAEIVTAVRGFGGVCDLTGEHPSGTDRVAEVVRRELPEAEIIVNLQGDEPELDPASIDRLVAEMQNHPTAEMGTLATPIRSLETLQSPSCVKVVCAADGRALYFSRLPIPYVRDEAPQSLLAGSSSPWLLHVGIYAYRREFLLSLTEKPVSRLESLEKLEQLRALEAGARIQVAVVEHHSVGIDTPDDYARFVERQRKRD
ncbi:MAG: 3-deoxy-D-manno-octulosonate cytidylyltransferase [Planctomycetales bacterium 12-60-4]|nr:MAG: 3-deoxy-D-manno-octulosonate cytidylyltransferase [Planctomycetales bacterium 12-60-4]